MKPLARICLIMAAVLPAPAVAQSITIPVSSPLNVISSDVAFGMSLTPLDANNLPISSLVLAWPASSSMQTSTQFTFPAQAAPYTTTGFELLVSPTGTGFIAKQPLLLDISLGQQLSVPSGIALLVTVNAPLSGPGSAVVSLGSDTLSPSAPTITATTPAQTSVVVSWAAATDNVGVAGYILERAPGTTGTFAGIVSGPVRTFNDTGLTLATVYSYRVRAMDTAGNLSPYSNVATVTTLGAAAPPPPAGTTSQPGDCTGATAASGSECSHLLPQLVDATGAVWTLAAGIPYRNGVKTSNPYSPGLKYLFVDAPPVQIRSRNKNGTYACWTGTAWGC